MMARAGNTAAPRIKAEVSTTAASLFVLRKRSPSFALSAALLYTLRMIPPVRYRAGFCGRRPSQAAASCGEAHELGRTRQVEHRVVQDAAAGGAIFLRAPLVGVMADAVLRADEDHAHRTEVRKLHPVVPGTAG